MVCHILDFSLLQEWLGTCGEYLKCVQKPFSKMAFKDMWKCNNTNLQDWFQTWSVVQFLWAVIVNIVVAVILSISGDVPSGIYCLVVGSVSAWFWAHIGWFAVVKKEGCCCLFIFCVSKAPLVLLIVGVWFIIWAALLILNSLSYIAAHSLGFIVTVCYATYAVTLIYMGMIMVKMWMQKSGEPQLGDTSAVVIGKASS